MNELFTLLMIILTIIIIHSLLLLFDKQGLYYGIIILDITTFILSFKIVEVAKLNINLGIISLIATLSIIYIFIIKYGIKDLKNIIQICLYINIGVAILLSIMNYLVPAITETISINIKGTFEYNYKLLIIYPIIIYLSQHAVVKLYSLIYKIQPILPICIILTYIITALLYVIIFNVISYINILSLHDSIYIGLSTYIVGLIVTIINTIYVNYLIKSKKVIK